jgi:hypothetical protein
MPCHSVIVTILPENIIYLKKPTLMFLCPKSSRRKVPPPPYPTSEVSRGIILFYSICQHVRIVAWERRE